MPTPERAAVGIEALSRGARRAIFIERSRAALQVIRDNVASLGLTRAVEIAGGKVATVLPRHNADIVFLDPPYALEREYDTALGILAANPPKLAIIQHSSRLELPAQSGRLRRTRVLKQGDNSLSFYEPDGT